MHPDGLSIPGARIAAQQDGKTASFHRPTPGILSGEGDDVPPPTRENIAGPGDINGASPLPYLTPDAMMVYCQTRLTSIDTQCSELMAKQQKTGRDQAALSDLTKFLTTFKQGFDDNANAITNMQAAYDSAINAVGPNSELGVKLTNDRANLKAGGDNKIFAEEMESLIAGVKGYQSNLNSDSELDMIHLQSLMSQRQTAIQLTTNIVQSLNDQVNKVVANIGH
jgi:hypothetical protein